MSRWQVVEFVLAAALEDPAAALLKDLGSVGWETREAGEGRMRLLAYWPAPAPAGLRRTALERLAELALRLGEPVPDVSPTQVIPEEDWEAGWRRHFRLERPLPDLVVHPSWISYAPAPGETVVVIDPKMAFGVGSHPTTRLCLRLLRDAQGLARVLDVGTGTGILAIAAARWGARRVVAVEMDGPSALNAEENVARNAVTDRVEVVHGRVEALEGLFDLVLANLLLSELHAALPRIAGLLHPGGALILAGYLASEARAVRRDLEEEGFRVVRNESEEEWGALYAHAGPAVAKGPGAGGPEANGRH